MTLQNQQHTPFGAGNDDSERVAAEDRQETLSIEIYVRSISEPSAHGYQSELLDLLRRLDQQGTIDGYDVTLMGEKICNCETCKELEPVDRRLERIREWRRWAAENGVTLLFNERTVRSSVTGDTYQFIVPPTATLVLSHDGAIESVLPNRSDGETETPGEFLCGLLQDDIEYHPTEQDIEESAF